MMPDGFLRFEHGEIRLADVLLPGILKSTSIRGQVRFDEAKLDGMSGKAKLAMGWEDSDITLGLELLSDDDSDCYSKLARINAVFKAVDNGANPEVYDVSNAHAIARGISRVVFSGLDSNETDEDDVIAATLNFVEHIPVVAQAEKRVVASDKAKGPAAPSTTAKEPEADAGIKADISPFAAGYSAGSGT